MSKTYSDKSHAENILQQLYQQRETDPFCDVVLIAGVEEIKIPAHRCILSAASGYFKGKFSSLRESKLKEVEIPSVNGDTLNTLMEYCYTGRVEIKEEVVQDVLQAADMLNLNIVANACGDFLAEHLHSTNCLGVMLLAERYHCESLLKQAIKYLSQNFVEVYKSAEFLALNLEQLRRLLVRNDLCVPIEEHIFNSLVTWIDSDRNEREKYKNELLKIVRLPLLKSEFLIDHVKPFCTSSECCQMYLEVMERHALPKCRKLLSSELTRPRGSYEYLMGITLSKASNKMYFHYYCPQQLKWMKWLNHLDYRANFGLAIMEKQLYFAGGQDNDGRILNTVMCLNMKTMKTTQVSPMIERRTNCSTAVLNGLLFVAGSFYERDSWFSSTEKWDPNLNTWDKVLSLPLDCTMILSDLNNRISRVHCESIHLRNNPLHMVAAANGLTVLVCKDIKKVWRYDIITNKYYVFCSLQKKLESQYACSAFQDKLVVCYNDHVVTYDGTTNEWKVDAFLKGLPNIYYAFSYGYELLESEFEEN